MDSEKKSNTTVTIYRYELHYSFWSWNAYTAAERRSLHIRRTGKGRGGEWGEGHAEPPIADDHRAHRDVVSSVVPLLYNAPLTNQSTPNFLFALHQSISLLLVFFSILSALTHNAVELWFVVVSFFYQINHAAFMDVLCSK